VYHNQHLGLPEVPALFWCAKALADIVVPLEYGVTREEKVDIARRICKKLIPKVRVCAWSACLPHFSSPCTNHQHTSTAAIIQQNSQCRSEYQPQRQSIVAIINTQSQLVNNSAHHAYFSRRRHGIPLCQPHPRMLVVGCAAGSAVAACALVIHWVGS